MSRNFYRAIQIINQTIVKSNVLDCVVPYTFFLIRVLNELKEKKLIRSFKVISNYSVEVHLQTYSGTNITYLKGIYCIDRAGFGLNTMSCKQIKTELLKSGSHESYLFSTNISTKSLLWAGDMVEINIGGLVVLKIIT